MVLVEGYFQLHFQDELLSVYNDAAIATTEGVCAQAQLGFANVLNSLIGSRVSSVSTDAALLELRFETGARLIVHADPAKGGREAYQFRGCDGLLVVEQNP